MSLAPREYFSSDLGAPVLNGTAGSLIAVLDAVLVNGYGSRTPLGWTKPFSGTNLAAYRNNPTFGSGSYLRVADTAAQVTAVRGYEGMTDVTTGTGMFPTAAQQAADTLIGKSNAASALARGWAIFGNARCFYLFIELSVGEPSNDCYTYFFGDINPYRAGDTGTFCIPFGVNTGTTAITTTTAQSRNFISSPGITLFSATTNANWFGYLARPFTSALVSVGVTSVVPGYNSQSFGLLSDAAQYPLGGANSLPLSRAYVLEQQFNGILRGEMPGVYVPLCSVANIPNYSLVSNVGDLPSGTNLRRVGFNGPSANSSSTRGAVFFDMTNNW